MPSSNSDPSSQSPLTPSPRILNHLSKFRYKKLNNGKKETKKTNSPSKQPNTPSKTTSPMIPEVSVVPETPEPQQGKSMSPVIRPVKETIPVSESDDDISKPRISEHKNKKSSSSSMKRNHSASPTKKKRLRLMESDDEDDVIPLPTKKSHPQSRRLAISSDSENESRVNDVGSGDESKTNSMDVGAEGSRTSHSSRGVIFLSDDSDDDNVGKVKKESGRKKGVIYCDSDEDDGGEVVVRKRKKKKKSSTRRQVNGDASDVEDLDVKCDMSKPVYDSDDSSDDMEETPARLAVLSFLNNTTLEELLCMPGCRHTKAASLISKRPFKSWADLVHKVNTGKHLSVDLLNGVQSVINTRKVVSELMRSCEKLSTDLEKLVSRLMEGKEDRALKKQPAILNPEMNLASYQMLGLNWLVLMHRQKLNGILADEMGLGKTVQAIAFLAHLLEEKNRGPHLIVVPSSTLENWIRELETWCTNLKVLVYFGSQDERRGLRREFIRGGRNDYNIIVTTYNLVSSSPEDRVMIKSIPFHYVIFDEAHMLKNMSSLRYKNLMKIKTKRRLLLTGTPLQNSLIELMSLLMFVMPDVFDGKTEEVVKMFGTSINNKAQKKNVRTKFEQERIEQAKHIMRPFLLRRLKSQVLKDLPKKHERIRRCKMLHKQQKYYSDLVEKFSKEVQASQGNLLTVSGLSMMMQLRKMANHPLLLRNHYTDKLLKKMSTLMLKEPTHRDALVELVFEDMQVMSDFELHRLCCMYKGLNSYKLKPKYILESGKFRYLKTKLEKLKETGDRILLFSQFTMMLDVVEEFLNILGYKFIRLDGSTPVAERQDLIDKFSFDSSIFIFLLSTKAGGLGINLTAANIVILHDIDFNPYNDKQAEDRCHRVGQLREVRIVRLLSSNSIEEGILQSATNKLQLEQDITAEKESTNNASGDVVILLKTALGL